MEVWESKGDFGPAFRMNVDITSDDNFWSCLIGGLPYILVRMGFDQMVVQRYMAASNVRAAKV